MSKLREKILNAKDIKEEKVLVPEWEAEILIKGLTGAARSKILADCIDQRTGAMDIEKFYPELIIATAFDPDTGEKVFEPADRDTINTKNGGVLEKVAQVAAKLSGLDQNAIGDALKN